MVDKITAVRREHIGKRSDESMRLKRRRSNALWRSGWKSASQGKGRSLPPGNGVWALLASAEAFADGYDDMSFTPPHLATIQARTPIV